MHFTALLALASVLTTNASPIGRAPLAKRAGPTVQIDSGTVTGSSSGGVDSFKGIPFAQPPVGNLRLKPPQPIQGSLGNIDATGTPRACPQQVPINLPNVANDVLAQIEALPFVQDVTNMGEDCLTLNVQRPSGVSANASLPVMVWIFGGGFELGSTQTYDATKFIQTSVSMDKPILYVAMNYRVSAFGFLQGKELQADGSTNLGLKDQRLALEWVQDNIAAFGGDPTKVTIWGESAGSISVFDHTIINGGDNSYKGGKLFRGAMMDSGSIVPAQPVDSPTAQNVYDTFAAAAGCGSAADTLACIRAAPYASLLAAQSSLPGIFSYRSLDLAYLPRPDPSDNFFSVSPEVSVANGKYTKVPIIIGDQEDEGTLFSLVQSNITNTDQLVDYLTSYFPEVPDAHDLVAGLVAQYPDDPSAGSPFNTSIFNEIYPEFKRLAAILGDVTFTLTRRTYLATVAATMPSWTYLSTYLYGTPVLGTFHGSDILASYGTLGTLNVPTQSIQRYYISFVNELDPNALGTNWPLISWPQWTESGREMLDFGALENSLITDDFREGAYEYLYSHPNSFRV